MKGCDRDRCLIEDSCGLATVEYVVALSLVTLTGALAVLALGVPLLKVFEFARLMITMPIP